MTNTHDFAAELWGRAAAFERRIAEEKRRHLELQDAGARASVETREQLLEQNKILKLQLQEQTEINQRLEHEFHMGAKEAVITRNIAYWSLGVSITGVIVAIVAIFVGVWV